MLIKKILFKLKAKYAISSFISNFQNEGLKNALRRSYNYIRYGRGTLAPPQKKDLKL